MVLDRTNNSIKHGHFYDILNYFKAGDIYCLNDSKVLPARLYGIKEDTLAKLKYYFKRNYTRYLGNTS